VEKLWGASSWHAPESYPRSYEPDNESVTVFETEAGIHFLQKTETSTGIQKELVLQLDPISRDYGLYIA